MSSLIPFISVLYFSVYSSFVSLGKFLLRYLIFVVAMVNGIDSLISLYDFSLLVYRNASDFCGLILYPATLLNSLISSSSVLASLVAQRLKRLPGMQETWVRSLGREDPLEKGMATHSSNAWRTPWTEEPGRLQSMRSQGVRHG